MKLDHPNIEGSVFKLIDLYELALNFGEDRFALRIELFQSLTDPTLFRYKTWRDELFRIQSTFPQDRVGQPEHGPSDEKILVGLGLPHINEGEDFYADNPEGALRKIKADLGKSLEHLTRLPPAISSD
jgi:hypothetical protein